MWQTIRREELYEEVWAVPIWVHDFENDTYGVPLGLGFGQVIPTKKVVYNVFIEPQRSVADKGASHPRWQVVLGFNMQFKRRSHAGTAQPPPSTNRRCPRRPRRE